MSNEKKKDDKAPKVEGAEGSDAKELDNEALDGVSGGMMHVVPGGGGPVALPGTELPTCISQQ